MLEVTGSINAIAQVTAAVTLAKCVSGSVGSSSSIAVTEAKITVHNVTGSIEAVSTAVAAVTLAKCVTGNIDAVSTITAISVKWKPGAGTITVKSTTQGTMVKGDPVGNPTQLSNLRNNLTKEYVLLDNIDLSGIANWEPIGTQAAPFTGILKGNGFVITGLTIDRQTTDYVGLFGYCQFNDAAKIPNLRDIVINNANVKGQDYVGIVAGYIETTLGSTGDAMAGDAPVGIIIQGCSTSGVVSGRTNVGGVFGGLKGPEFAGHTVTSNASYYSVWDDWIARVNGLSSSANVAGTGQNIGGLVGNLYEITIAMSNATGTVQGGDMVGGIVGYGYRCAVLTSYSTGDVTGLKVVGGIAGAATYRPTIRYCYTEGDITGTSGDYPGLTHGQAGVGGIVGLTDADIIDNCYVLGDISGVWRVGGLAGSYTGGDAHAPNVSCCYTRGNVTGNQAGGMIGFIWPGIFEAVDFYCIGSVSNNSSSGAIIGTRGSYSEYPEIAPIMPDYDKPVGEISFRTEAFFNSDVNFASTKNGGVGVPALDLQKASTYEQAVKAWQFFDRYWVIDDEEGDYYPQLRSLYEPYGLAINLIRGSQGLLLGYLQAGELFYRKLDGTAWLPPQQIPGVVAAETMNMFRTRDDRLGFVIGVNQALRWILTDQNEMTISGERQLGTGFHGDLVHTPDDEAVVFVISDIGTISQFKGDVAEDWAGMLFSAAEPLPSDSQMAHLRADIAGSKAFLVWRSRGQHRVMVTTLEKPKLETHAIRSGTITLTLDSPIVSASVEFDTGGA